MIIFETSFNPPVDILAKISGILAVSAREAHPILKSDMGRQPSVQFVAQVQLGRLDSLLCTLAVLMDACL